MAGNSWYNTNGYDGADQERDRIARSYGPNRFWMKVGSTREVVFLDDEPFGIHEHQFRANGHWRNWATCLQGVHDIVPCCEKLGNKSRGYVAYYTVLDLTEAPKEAGAAGIKYQYEVKFLPAKLTTLKTLKRKKLDKGSLVGLIFKVSRDSTDDPNCGGEFEFSKETDLDKLFKIATYRGKKLVDLYKESTEKADVLARLKDTFQVKLDGSGHPVPSLAPFNYMKLLEPMAPRELKLILTGASTDDDTSSGGKDSEIPF